MTILHMEPARQTDPAIVNLLRQIERLRQNDKRQSEEIRELRALVRGLLPAPAAPEPTASLVGLARVAAQLFGAHAEDVMGMERRDRRTVLARSHVWRELAGRGWPASKIARKWDCHHTTVLHALKQEQPTTAKEPRHE